MPGGCPSRTRKGNAHPYTRRSTVDRPTKNPNGIESEAPFDVVLERELQEIDARRTRIDGELRHLCGHPKEPTPRPPAKTSPSSPPGEPDDRQELLEQVRRKARERRLVGLTFSGGGIRSASFNLGVLQGLAGLGLLRFLDYLSTVSGGGYIGSWLAAWVRRQRGGLLEVE